MMKEKVKVIVNADDFGFSEAVNYGILKAHKQGIVTSTSIMANMPGFAHAVELWKKNPTLRVGVHLNITCGKPVLTDHQTMTNEEGYFVHGNEDSYSDYEIFEELCAQMEKVLAAGIEIDHLDSHHHIHTEERFQKVMEKLLRKYPYPIRGGFTYKNDYPFQSTLCTKFYDDGVSYESLVSILKQFEADKIYDVMCHPAFIDDVLVKHSSYLLPRVKELEILCSEEVKQAIEDLQIELVTYNCV